MSQASESSGREYDPQFDLLHDPSFAQFHRSFLDTERKAGRDPENPAPEDVQRFWAEFEAWMEAYSERECPRVLAEFRSGPAVTERASRLIRGVAEAERYWGSAFKVLSDLISTFERLVVRSHARLRQAEELAPWSYYARAALGARGLGTALEVELLLQHGFVLGAWARWRTLHELAVVGKYIARNGEETAQAYCGHALVQRTELLKALHAHHQSSALLGALLEEHHASVTALKEQAGYGDGYETSYGWAARKGWKQKPTLADLVKEVGMQSAHAHYVQANRAVHAGIGGYSDWNGAWDPSGRPSRSATSLGEALQLTGSMLTDLGGSIVSQLMPPDDFVLLRLLLQLREELRAEIAHGQEKWDAEAARTSGD